MWGEKEQLIQQITQLVMDSYGLQRKIHRYNMNNPDDTLDFDETFKTIMEHQTGKQLELDL